MGAQTQTTSDNSVALVRAGEALLEADRSKAAPLPETDSTQREVEKRSISVNTVGVENANSLIEAGKIDAESDWSFSADDGNAILGDPADWAAYRKWFLATDTDQEEETKAFYKYPFGKEGKVYRKGVIAAKSRAAAEGDDSVSSAADTLLKKIDEKLGLDEDAEKKEEPAKKNLDQPDALVCSSCGTIAPLHISGSLEIMKASDCSTCGLGLIDSVVAKAFGSRFTFEEGDEGIGVLQTHEMGLSELQACSKGSFGWEGVEPTEKQLEQLKAVHDAPWDVLVQKAAAGNSAPLAQEIMKMDTSSLDADVKGTIALIDPVSVHTNILLQKNDADHWEGCDLLTGVNQFQDNALRLSVKSEKVEKVLANFRLPGDGTLDAKVIQGSTEWLEVGKNIAKSFSPGAPGSTDDTFSRFKIVDTFTWKAGVQSDSVKEFIFDSEVIKGAFVFEASTMADGRTEWTLSQKQEQRVRSVNEDNVITVKIAKAEKRLVTGVVLQPDIIDGQGDLPTEEAVEKMCHKFMEAWIQKEAQLGVQHEDYERDIELIENYVAMADMIVDGEVVKKGSWVMTVKVNDDEVWEAVKSGELTAFSIKGSVRVIQQTEAA